MKSTKKIAIVKKRVSKWITSRQWKYEG